MGISQSLSNAIDGVYSTKSENNEDNVAIEEFSDQPIVVDLDLLIEVLSYVPAKDLILKCRLVCKQWQNVIDSQSVWRLKCERENVKLPTRKFAELPKHHYRYVYLYAMRKVKNLVNNPCGESKLDGWTVKTEHNFYVTHNQTFLVENPPAGADAVPDEVGSQSCFVTTYTPCEKYQKIYIDDPVLKYLLQHDLVKIKVGEWYAARFDCASEYKFAVHLYDQSKSLIDKFEFEYVEEQWTGREWHLVTHVFDNVTDVSYIIIRHYGKDRQFWAGYYGSKMTGASVELCIK